MKRTDRLQDTEDGFEGAAHTTQLWISYISSNGLLKKLTYAMGAPYTVT